MAIDKHVVQLTSGEKARLKKEKHILNLQKSNPEYAICKKRLLNEYKALSHNII